MLDSLSLAVRIGFYLFDFIGEETLTRYPYIDLKELALEVTTDPDHKFDLSLSLDDLDGALAIARTLPQPESESKWKAIGDRALAVWRFELARECFEQAGDLNSLMLLLMSIGDRDGLEKLAVKSGKFASDLN